MDQRERVEDPEEALRAAMDGRLADLWTAMPGIIETYDATKQIASVQPALQRPYRGPDGKLVMITLPLLLDCPVYFPSGGGVTLTFPVVKGDECQVVFSCRCIDSWWQSGGIQPPAEYRMHDLSDGHAYVGFRSQPRKLAGVSTTKAQLRNDAGDTFVELDPVGQIVKIAAPGGIVLDGPVTATSTIHAAADITSDTDVLAGGVSLKTHTHGGVQAGASNTGAPN